MEGLENPPGSCNLQNEVTGGRRNHRFGFVAPMPRGEDEAVQTGLNSYPVEFNGVKTPDRAPGMNLSSYPISGGRAAIKGGFEPV